MLWTIEKLKARVKELSAYRYRDRRQIPEFRWRLDPEGAVATYPPEDGGGRPCGWATAGKGEIFTLGCRQI